MLKSFGLTGRSDNKVDLKGRLNIPSSMRKKLAPESHDEVVVLYVPTGNLLLFEKEYWDNTIQQSFIDDPSKLGEQDTWRAINRLSENANTSTVDSQGRITIPNRLLKSAGIDRKAVVIGAFDRVFIWDPLKYDEWMSKGDPDAAISKSGIS